MKKIYNYKGLVKLVFLCCVLFFSTFAFGQFYKPGNVPTLWPVGGFGAEGDGYKNVWFYPDSAVNNVGDWFPYLDANPPVGTGGSIFDANGILVPHTSSQAIIAHFLDKYKKDPGGDQSVFAMSDKINDNPNTYNVKAGSVPQKDDIQHATAVFTWGDPGLTPVIPPPPASETGYVATGNPNDLWCLFAGDRWVTNGDSYIDFEFNQAAITWDQTTGNFATFAPVLDANGDPTGGRTPGDLLLTIHFLNGGAIGEVFVDEWQNDGLHTAYSWHSQNIAIAPYLQNLFMVFNNTITHVPWSVYDQPVGPDGHYFYVVNQFAEGALNLTQTMLGNQECGTIATVWVRTKSSHSSTAQLKDLAGIMTVNIPVPQPVVTCPDPVDLPACSTLAEVQDAWDDWIDGFSFTDGSEPFTESYTPALPTSLPEGAECGWTFTTKYKVTDHCLQADSCTSTFTVEAPEPVEVSCPGDTIVTYVDAADFLTQDQVDVLFNAWLSGFEYSGGCNPEPSPLDYDAPNHCGGTVTVTFSATDDCGQSDECTASFFVDNQIDATVSCPDDPLLPACTLQADIEAAYQEWVDGFIVIEACPPWTTNIADIPTLPVDAECEGVSLSFTFTVDDACDLHAECTSTFTVGATEDIAFTPPVGADLDACGFADQVALDAAFDAWLLDQTDALVTGMTGGCDPEVTNDWDGLYLGLCEGGDIIVEWTIEDLCETLTTSAEFSVDAPVAIAFTPPVGADLDACDFADQAALNAAFDAWLLDQTDALVASITGGCDPEVTNDWDGLYLGLCEGGDIIVEWTIEDLCETLTTSAEFSVDAPVAIAFTPPVGADMDACGFADQAALDAAFDAWLLDQTEALEASITDGCDPEVTNDWDGLYLGLCEGGDIIVEWTIEDLCETLTTSAEFSVDAPEAIAFTPPVGADLDACDFADQAALDAAFDAWLLDQTDALVASITGGCDPEVTNDWDGLYLGLCEGGDIIVEWTIEDLCETLTTSAEFSVDAPVAIAFTPPVGTDLDACDFADQAALDAAFDAWLLDQTDALVASITGGCDPEVTNDWDGLYLGLCEGGDIIVEWTIEDLCETLTNSAEFSVDAPVTIAFTPPVGSDMDACDFADQAALNAAFDAWLLDQTEALEASVTGGCDPEVTNDWDGLYLGLCEGGDIIVEWTIEDLCETLTTSAEFSVDAPVAIAFTPPVGADLDACDFADQAALDAAFDAWLLDQTDALEASITGGCDAEVTNDWDGLYLGLCEGGDIIVEWTITDLCETLTTSAEFSVDAPEAISFTDVEGLTVSACDFADQTALEAAFDAWLLDQTDALEASILGGCDPEVSNDWDGTYPVMCEGGITAEWTIDDLCESFTSSATFTVTPPDAIVILCPDPVALGDCTPEADIIVAYDAWKLGFTSSGDCSLSDNMIDFPPLVILPDGSVNLSFTYIVTGLCDATEHTCSSTFTVGPCAPNCGTVYAKLDNDEPGGPDVAYARCFEEDGFSRWGWTNYIPFEGTYSMNIYAGAAHCIYSPEKLEGTVLVTYEGGELTVQYLMDAGFSLNEVHVNVACDMYPVGPNGKITVAPGQYIFGADGFGYVSDLTVTFTDVTGPVWVIIHGIACDVEGEGSATFEYTDPIHCPPPATSPGKEASDITPQSKADNSIDVNIHPNPFIGSTDIEFTIPWSGEATVEIYNALGDKITTLFDATVDANQKYSVRFTAPDQSGQGMFLCVIRSEKGYVVKHMILNR